MGFGHLIESEVFQDLLDDRCGATFRILDSAVRRFDNHPDLATALFAFRDRAAFGSMAKTRFSGRGAASAPSRRYAQVWP